MLSDLSPVNKARNIILVRAQQFEVLEKYVLKIGVWRKIIFIDNKNHYKVTFITRAVYIT